MDKKSLVLKVTKDQDYTSLILKYSGFYVSRYEAGLPDELHNLTTDISADTNNIQGIPVSKPGVIPWNFISIKNAKYNAENMYDKNSNFMTTLPDSSSNWCISVWISEYFPAEKRKYANVSSSNFTFTGYYSDDDGKNYKFGNNIEKKGCMLLSTGSSKTTKVKNIYDIWGNVSEACITKISQYNYIYANTNSDNYKMDFKESDIPFNNPSSYKGFRIVLYLY